MDGELLLTLWYLFLGAFLVWALLRERRILSQFPKGLGLVIIILVFVLSPVILFAIAATATVKMTME